MKILATDSGLEKTGYSIFEVKNKQFDLINFGLVKTSKNQSLETRVVKIYQEFEKIINDFKPKVLVLEKLFFNTNQKTLISIAQTQGILLLLAGKKNLKVEFITPLLIKQIITGYGRADKEQVRKMIKLILPNVALPKSDDTIDAIACGLAFFYLKKNDWKN